jgi:hypothetical protein
MRASMSAASSHRPERKAPLNRDDMTDAETIAELVGLLHALQRAARPFVGETGFAGELAGPWIAACDWELRPAGHGSPAGEALKRVLEDE